MPLRIVKVVRALVVLVLLLGAGVDAELLHAHGPAGASSIDCPGCLASATTGALPIASIPPAPPTLVGAERPAPRRVPPAVAPARRVGVRGPP